MSEISALQSGLAGIQRGLEGLRRDAGQIARVDPATKKLTSEVTKPLVTLSVDRMQAAVGSKVVKTVDETIGTLLDVMA